MIDLFGNEHSKEIENIYIPLAERMRPDKLDDFAGQKHLLDPGKPIRVMIEKKEPLSMILWGPPGVGKTTLAILISFLVDSEFIQLSAVSAGVKDVRAAIDKADYNLRTKKKRTILFIDEIHRFNKAQQDSLLHSVENGIITLIGATTENPSFEVISPLISRSRVYILEELNKDDLEFIITNSLQTDSILSKLDIRIENRKFLIQLSNGDARKLLNGIDLAVKLSTPDENNVINLTNEIFMESFQTNYIKYDKNLEEHYNIISAFIKSMRGSDPDAAVYWLARMMKGGEEPKFIARRMIILASEDIGNAEPNALVMATNAFTAVNYIGMPEAALVLAQTAIYLASCPKSNASYKALNKAKEDIEKYNALDVPVHLRNAPTKLMKELNYGKDYKYSHDFEKNFVEQDYLPEKIKNKRFFNAQNNPQEVKINERQKELWKNRK